MACMHAPAGKRGFLRRRMKWELEEVLSLPIGDKKKEWMLSKNLTNLVGWT
jgi:hypothetical protein